RSSNEATPLSATPGVRSPKAGKRNQTGNPMVAAPYVKTATSASAIQKLGAAYIVVVATVIAVSSGRPRRAACAIPIGTPRRKVSATDANPSPSETGAASASTESTGRLAANDSPRSPRTTASAQRAYWTTTGRSSPRSLRSRSASAAVAVGGTRNTAGSP